MLAGPGAWTICFTSELILRQLRLVRCKAAVFFSFLLVSTGLAQQQERSLIDRLLRPDMELQNRAQGKTFTVESKIVERRGTVGTFYLQSSVNEKSFGPTLAATTAEYRHREFPVVSRATSPSQSRDAEVPAKLTSSTAHDVHEAYDGVRQIARLNLVNERTFRDEGKSQKSLNRQNPPLTIDQVRELLNKNK
jgi:hypothetical protein